MRKNMNCYELLRLAKNDPKQLGEWYSEVGSHGVNFHFAPSVVRDMEVLFDRLVDNQGHVQPEAMTGMEAFAILAGVASIIGLGIAISEAMDDDGGTTITVTESGDGDANVNVGTHGEGGGNTGE